MNAGQWVAVAIAAAPLVLDLVLATCPLDDKPRCRVRGWDSPELEWMRRRVEARRRTGGYVGKHRAEDSEEGNRAA